VISRWKPLAIIAGSLAALLLYMAVTSRLILLDSFVQLEEQNTRRNVERVLDALADDLVTLSSKSGDWSNWDDTYAFIIDGNPEYIRSNLVDNAFVELQINVILFLNASGRLVYGRAFDYRRNEEIPVPADLARHLSTDGLLVGRAAARASSQGLLLLDEGPLLLAARPILTSEGEGEARGTLIMGRFLDREALERLATITHLSLRVDRLDDPQLPGDARQIRPLLSNPETIVVRPLGRESVAGYALLQDVYERPVLMLRVDLPRAIYRQGEKTIGYFLLLFTAASLVFAVVSQLLLYRLGVWRQRRQESEERYRAIVEQSAEGIVLVEAGSGALIEANRAFREIFGYADGELRGMTLADLDPPAAAGQEEGPLNVSMGEQSCIVGERRCRRKDGALLDVELRAGPVTCEGRERLCLVVHDVTERKKLENQLRLSQKLEAVGQLAGGVAHDFNNILTAIIGYCSLIAMQLKEDDPARQHLDQILAAADRAAHLTHGLLAFSRKQILTPKPVELGGIIRNMEKFLTRLISEDVELRTSLADRELMVVADSGQIDQVLMNLATNARDAMPDGGLLTIESGREELDEGFVAKYGYGRPGAYALISVSDTGAGMNEAVRQRIFEPFFTTKEPGRGTGLGLSIVYGIVKQHGGFINVFSEPGRGTTFKIYLPLIRRAAAEEPAEEAPAAACLGGSETILLAEDDARVRRLTREILERFGYRVIEAADGVEAVARFKEHSGAVALVVLDLMMPRKSGREAYEEIRQVRCDVRALFTSGYTAYVVQRQRILEEGLDFVSKPVEPAVFLKKVREVLDR
jgi:PAS domain S-box-containing protein